ncbi:MAG: hypothetical protein NTU73_09955 [Ignavibacteriae bacterium]|nr:hypothetical protein [Ignavibacteriota bacterium]
MIEYIILGLMILALIVVLWALVNKRLLSLLKAYKESYESYKAWKPRADEMIDRLHWRLNGKEKILELANQLNTAYDNQVKFLNRMCEDYKNGMLKVNKPKNTFYTVHFDYDLEDDYNGVYTSLETVFDVLENYLRDSKHTEKQIEDFMKRTKTEINADLNAVDSATVFFDGCKANIQMLGDWCFYEIYKYFKAGGKEEKE